MEVVLKRGRALAVLLAAWALANGATHLILWLLAKKIYYQMSPPVAIAAEASISLLNFLLPLLLVRYYFREPSLREACAWRWTGSKVIGLGVIGFLALMALFSLLNIIFHNQQINYGPFGTRPMTGAELRVLVVMLLVLPALLFGLRHHPSDIYFALQQHASGAAWGNRLQQLYGMAVLLGVVWARAGSTWASWLVHTGMILLIISLGGMWKFLLG